MFNLLKVDVCSLNVLFYVVLWGFGVLCCVTVCLRFYGLFFCVWVVFFILADIVHLKLKHVMQLKATYLFVLLFLLSNLPITYSQISSTDIQMRMSQSFSKYTLIEADAAAIYTSILNDDYSWVLELDKPYNLDLVPTNLLGKNYLLTSAKDQSIIDNNATRAIPLQGQVEGDSQSEVRLTIGRDMIYGFIKENGKTIFVEPIWYYDLSFPKGVYVVYDADDALVKEGNCGVTDVEHKYNEMGLQEKTLMGQCLDIEVAIASDFSIFEKYGSSIEHVENRNIGVMNNVQGLYDDEFENGLFFVLVEQFVSDCESCDPLNAGNNAIPIIQSFENWGPSGFVNAHDIGSFWSTRDYYLSGEHLLGLAGTSGVCAGHRYNILKDFSANADLIRTLTAHEFGHNMGSSHDAASSNYIMQPSVSTSTTWSNSSITAINNKSNSANCLSPCSPVASFTQDTTVICDSMSIGFSNLSSANAESFMWMFEGGTPSTSMEENPVVVYDTPGVYGVTLVAAVGDSSHEIVKQELIQVYERPTAGFSFSVEENLYTFTNESIGALTYMWDFGDGVMSTEENPSHMFTESDSVNISLTVTNANGCSDMYTVEENVVFVSSNDFSTGNQFTVFPNPVKEVLGINFQGNYMGEISYRIYDMYGKLLLNNEFNKSQERFVQTINLPQLAAGTYVLQLSLGEDSLYRKIVVVK